MSKKQTDKLVVKVKPPLDLAEGLKCEIVSDKPIKFTAAKAFEYLELDTFHGERPVNERHVQFLYNAWSGGRFMWDHVILCCCDYDKKRYRINGQHTAWMRVNIKDSDLKTEPEVREVVYSVASEEQLRILYSTFDQNKVRSPAHVFKALMSGTREAVDLWPSILTTLSAGLKLWLFERDRALVSSNDLAKLASSDKYQPLFRIVGLYYQTHYDEALWIRRSAVVASLFATFEKSGGKAPEFWDPVFTGLNLADKTDARYALRNFLQTHKQSLKGKGVEITSAEDTYRVCILAWNKWRIGQKVSAGLRTTEDRQKPR